MLKVFGILFNAKLGEYSDVCLKTDVLLLVFETFRDVSIKTHILDP